MRRLGGLWRNQDFLWLWSSQTISQFGSQISQLAVPLVAIVAQDLDLDQFMRGKGAVHFGQHRRGDAAVAHHDLGLERVGAGLQVRALAGRQ